MKAARILRVTAATMGIGGLIWPAAHALAAQQIGSSNNGAWMTDVQDSSALSTPSVLHGRLEKSGKPVQSSDVPRR